MGDHTTASNLNSTALGASTTASGLGSTAMGVGTTANGNFSTAMGFTTTASGPFSTVMGAYASTNLTSGSFVYGDLSTSASSALVQATADNSFVARASGGFRFRTSPDLSTGCDVSGGTSAGNLNCSGTIQSTSGGFRFPDNTVQTTAATGGGAASDVVCTGCVGTSDLADGAVTAVKLAAGVARNTHWAGVTSAGTVFKQTGGISGSLTGTGTYDLTFPSGLNLNTGCTNLASGIDGSTILQTIDGPRFGAPSNVLRVRVFDAAGSLVNAGFEVAVICL